MSSRHQQHISVAVRVRPLDVDPSVTKDASEKDNVMMIDDRHIGFVPDISQRIQHANNLRRLASSLAKDVAKDTFYNQIRSLSAGPSSNALRTQSPRAGGLKRGGALNWPTFMYDHCFGPRECYEAFARTFATNNTQIRGTQEDVFETIGRPAAETVLGGYHCCILAYGQTGSGKTYSMLGPCGIEGGVLPATKGHASNNVSSAAGGPKHRSVTPQRNEPSFIGFTKRPPSSSAYREDVSQIQSLKSHPQRGLIIRIIEGLLEEMCLRSATDLSFRYEMSCSYYQIYKEKAWDLLLEREGRARGGLVGEPLRLRMNERLDPYLEGLVERPIRSLDQMLAVLDLGIRNRRVASTQHNMQSSRSHAILTLNLSFGTPKETFRSRLYLVDLAGSERIGSLVSSDREHNTVSSAVLLSSRNRGITRQQLKPDEQQWQEAAAAQIAEASDINSSLSALGKVIHVLSEMKLGRNKAGQTHIPYRDSLLTMVLKNCFGGNARTFMLATVSPYMRDSEESLSTLRFCSRAKLIVNKPVKNNHKARLAEVEGLRTENAQLRRHVEELEEQLQRASENGISNTPRSGSFVRSASEMVPRRISTPVRRGNSQATTVWEVPSVARERSVRRADDTKTKHLPQDEINSLYRADPSTEANVANNPMLRELVGMQQKHLRIITEGDYLYDVNHGHDVSVDGYGQPKLYNSPQRAPRVELGRGITKRGALVTPEQSKITRGDLFRPRRLHADPLDDRGGVVSLGVGRLGAGVGEEMGDDLVQFPDGIEGSDEGEESPPSSLAPKEDKGYGDASINLVQQPMYFASPHQMNCTQPPNAPVDSYPGVYRHPIIANKVTPRAPLYASSSQQESLGSTSQGLSGLVSSRATTPLGYSAKSSLSTEPRDAMGTVLRGPPGVIGLTRTTEELAAAQASRGSRNPRRTMEHTQLRPPSQSSSPSSASDSGSESEEESEEEIKIMRQLLEQITAMTRHQQAGGELTSDHLRLLAQARALSPSARNPNFEDVPSERPTEESSRQDLSSPIRMGESGPTSRAAVWGATPAPAPKVQTRRPQQRW